MARKILVADLLCGAGGSSTGCARALDEIGLKMDHGYVEFYQNGRFNLGMRISLKHIAAKHASTYVREIADDALHYGDQQGGTS